jgi:prevent-host-death family protein
LFCRLEHLDRIRLKTIMTIKAATESRRHWRELLDSVQESPVAITRKGAVVAYVISPRMMEELAKTRIEVRRG